MILNLIALMMLIIVISFVVSILCFLGGLPGRIAQQRQHLQADAIRILGWLGLLTGGILWGVALVWAYITPRPAPLLSPSGKPESAAAKGNPQRDHSLADMQGGA
jgi:hypothetical protein